MAQHICSLFHILTSKSSAVEIKDHPLQVLPCRCENEANSWPIEGNDVIVRCEDEQMGSYQLGLRFIDLGIAWAGEQLEVRRFHILAGAILERPTSITSPVHVLESSELLPFRSPNHYLKLEFRRPAILHTALISSFNWDILAAVMDAKREGFREFDRHVRPEFVNACWLMSQFVQIFEKMKSSHPSQVKGDELPGVGEDLILEVEQKLGWSESTRVNERSHIFLSNMTRCRSIYHYATYHHATWYSLDGKCCWIDAPLHREAIWEVVNVARMEYKPPTGCHTGRLTVTALTAKVDIKHPFSITIHRGQTVDSGTGLGVCIRVPNVIEINFRSFAVDCRPIQVGMGKLPCDTSGLSTFS